MSENGLNVGVVRVLYENEILMIQFIFIHFIYVLLSRLFPDWHFIYI